jgi:hypothetical protein
MVVGKRERVRRGEWVGPTGDFLGFETKIRIPRGLFCKQII